MGGVASTFAPAGALWGSLYGAGTGSVIGGVGSVMTGGDIKEGIIFGAATGLVGGGIQGYCSAKSQGLNPWTGTKLPETTVNTPNVPFEAQTEMTTGGGKPLKVEQRSLQHMFSRHSKDFGFTSNWSKTAAAEFEEVLRMHMEGVTPIQGTYRGTLQVLHYFDSNTRLNVMTDMSGNLVGGWKLGEEQIKYLLSTGAIK